MVNLYFNACKQFYNCRGISALSNGQTGASSRDKISEYNGAFLFAHAKRVRVIVVTK